MLDNCCNISQCVCEVYFLLKSNHLSLSLFLSHNSLTVPVLANFTALESGRLQEHFHSANNFLGDKHQSTLIIIIIIMITIIIFFFHSFEALSAAKLNALTGL